MVVGVWRDKCSWVQRACEPFQDARKIGSCWLEETPLHVVLLIYFQLLINLKNLPDWDSDINIIQISLFLLCSLSDDNPWLNSTTTLLFPPALCQIAPQLSFSPSYVQIVPQLSFSPSYELNRTRTLLSPQLYAK